MQQFYWFSINKASSHFFQTSSLFPATSSKAISTRTSCQTPTVQASHLALPLQTCCSSWPLKNGNPFQNIKIKIKMQREKPTPPTKTSFSSWWEAQQRCYPVPQPTSALLAAPTPPPSHVVSTHNLLCPRYDVKFPFHNTHRVFGCNPALPSALRPPQTKSQHPCWGAVVPKRRFQALPGRFLFILFSPEDCAVFLVGWYQKVL